MKRKVDIILEITSRHYGIAPDVVLSRSQSRKATEARGIALHISLRKEKVNTRFLSRYFKRCRSAVYWLIDKYEWLVKHDRQVRENYQQIIRRLERIDLGRIKHEPE